MPKNKNEHQIVEVKFNENFMSRIWHLSHVHYTGRFLPRHKTAYPALVMIVVLVGVLVVFWTKNVTAMPLVTGLNTLSSPLHNELSHLVKYIWSGYGVVALMLFSFWLGENKNIIEKN